MQAHLGGQLGAGAAALAISRQGRKIQAAIGFTRPHTLLPAAAPAAAFLSAQRAQVLVSRTTTSANVSTKGTVASTSDDKKKKDPSEKASKEHVNTIEKTLAKKILGINVKVELLKSAFLGPGLEREVREKFRSLFGDALGRHPVLLDPTDLFARADTARQFHVISRDEHTAAVSVDIVIAAGVLKDVTHERYLVGEISQRIEVNDVDRATTQAGIWSRILGVDDVVCVPYVVGRRASKTVLGLAGERGVRVVLVREEVLLDEADDDDSNDRESGLSLYQ